MEAFQNVSTKWFGLHEMEIAESTAYSYQKSLNFINEYFYNMDINEIGREDIQNYIKLLYEKGYKSETITNYFKLINMTFEYAMDYEIIPKWSSPCYKIVIPKTDKKEINPFSELEMEKILKVKCIHWLYSGEFIAYRTGMRKGEIYALRKQDIDFNGGFIKVQKTQSMNKNGKIILKEPKSKSSRRRIACDKILMNFLWNLAHKSESTFLFPNNDTFFVPWNISTAFSKICETANVPRRTFHELRHTHASVLLAHNVHPKVVQERLGHSSIETTINTYSHLIPDMQYTAVTVFNKIA